MHLFFPFLLSDTFAQLIFVPDSPLKGRSHIIVRIRPRLYLCRWRKFSLWIFCMMWTMQWTHQTFHMTSSSVQIAWKLTEEFNSYTFCTQSNLDFISLQLLTHLTIRSFSRWWGWRQNRPRMWRRRSMYWMLIIAALSRKRSSSETCEHAEYVKFVQLLWVWGLMCVFVCDVNIDSCWRALLPMEEIWLIKKPKPS